MLLMHLLPYIIFCSCMLVFFSNAKISFKSKGFFHNKGHVRTLVVSIRLIFPMFDLWDGCDLWVKSQFIWLIGIQMLVILLIIFVNILYGGNSKLIGL